MEASQLAEPGEIIHQSSSILSRSNNNIISGGSSRMV
jgi:hypothetical protein